MTPEQLISGFDVMAEAPNGTAALRGLVLDLAVRGKLVAQDPADEPASVLLKRRSQVEAPFALPETWAWLCLPEVADYAVGKTPATKNPQYWGSDAIPWVSIGDLNHGREVLKTSRTITPLAAATIFRRPPARAGTILMSFKLTIGKVSLLATDAYHNEAIISVAPKPMILRDYLFLVLPQRALLGESNDAIMGATLNGKSLARIQIPVPPLAEQHRIVARVDALMSLLDRLESARTAREATRAALRDAALAALRDADTPEDVDLAFARIAERMDDLFKTPADVEPLRQTILQLAVRGRLVPQDPTDEPASVLLGKRRMDPVPVPVPFGLPSGWAWSAISRLGVVLGGGTPSKQNSKFWEGAVPWVSPKDMKRDFIDDSQDHISEAALGSSAVKSIPRGALLMVVRGMILAHSFPTALTTARVTINQDMKALVPFDGAVARFLLLATKGLKPEILGLVERSTHGTCKLQTAALFSSPIPIPPLAEQHRIVAKVDALLALCDRLATRLADATAAQDAFAAAAAHHLDA